MEKKLFPFIKLFFLIFLFYTFLVLISQSFCDETSSRLALVIGNSKYQHISSLRNPTNDAEDLAAALKQIGFKVTTLLNATKREMLSEIRKFGEELRRHDTGLFYFAGHGLQFEGRNYLVAVDSDIVKDIDIPFESLDLGRILAEMEDAGTKVNIVILDACRNNPYSGKFRSVERGLSVVRAPKGSLIVYSTAPGDVALDGEGRNGVFTEALLKHISKPGIDIEVLLKDVRQDVQIATKGRQVPWTNSSLTTGFYFVPPQKENASSTTRPRSKIQELILERARKDGVVP